MWRDTPSGRSREVMAEGLAGLLAEANGRPPRGTSERTTASEDDSSAASGPVLVQRSIESSSSLGDIHRYLLGEDDDGALGASAPVPGGPRASLAQSSLNLFNTIVGAGEMALPMAFNVLGVLGGSLCLLLVTCIMADSVFTLIRVSCLRRKASYGDLVGAYLGRWGALLVRVSLILTCLGFLISYTIIYGDLLIGKDHEGLLPSWTGHESGPVPWYLQKEVVVAVTCLLFVFPLTCLRSLERLASASLFKFGFSCVYVAATLLTVAAAVHNQAYTRVRMWPDFKAFGTEPLEEVAKLMAVLPVVLTAYSCHFNVHPLMHELENFTEGRMMTVMHTGLQTSTIVFAIVGISGYVCFGDGISPDVLQNYTSEYMAPFFGQKYAMLLVGVLKMGYFLLLVCTYPLLNWPFRENILELVGAKESDLGDTSWCVVSGALVVLVYIISMSVPTIWQALSLMGSTSAVMVIFIFPGAIQMLSASERFDMSGTARRQLWQLRIRQARGLALILLGLGVGACGVYSALTADEGDSSVAAPPLRGVSGLRGAAVFRATQ
eukprot:jgi/Tetstr1/421267/TSEL_001140.t1